MDELKQRAEVILETAKAIVDYPLAANALIADGARWYGPDAEANGFEDAVNDEVARERVRRSKAKRKAAMAA